MFYWNVKTEVHKSNVSAIFKQDVWIQTDQTVIQSRVDSGV